MNCPTCKKSDEVVTRGDGSRYCLDCATVIPTPPYPTPPYPTPEDELESLRTSNALLRATICALIGDSEMAVFRDDLQANQGKRIDFVPEPSGIVYWIRAVDEKPTTETETQQP